MEINIMEAIRKKMGEHGSPQAVSNSPSTSTCREAPARRRDMETVGETGTEDAAAEIVFPRGKQNQTFTNASETTFEPISAYPSARA